MATPSPRVLWRSALLSENGPPPTARLVGCALAEHVNQAGQAWPGVDRLTEITGLGERSVRNHLATLARLGWLECVAQGGVPGGPRTTRWRITTPAPDAGVNDSPTPAADAKVKQRPRHLVPTTPASGSTTPAPRAPEPVEPVDDESEASGGVISRDTPDRDPFEPPPDVIELARGMVSHKPEEVDREIERLIEENGHDEVLAVVTAMKGSPFRFASKFIAALETKLSDAYWATQPDPFSFMPADHPLKPTPRPHEGCTRCGGHATFYEAYDLDRHPADGARYMQCPGERPATDSAA